MSPEKRQTSVRAGEAAAGILGGWSTTGFQLAIKCWASELARRTAELSNVPDEWGYLAEAIRNMRFEPFAANPGPTVAAAVEGRHAVEGLGNLWFDRDEADRRVADLASDLREMDYATAWAVIWACMFHQANAHRIKQGDPWWTIAYRKAKVEEWKE